MLPMGLLLVSGEGGCGCALSGTTSSTQSQWHWRRPLTTARQEVSGANRTKPHRGRRPPVQGEKRPSVLKEIELQGEVARVRLTEVSGLLHPGYVPQLHSDEEDAEFIKCLSRAKGPDRDLQRAHADQLPFKKEQFQHRH